MPKATSFWDHPIEKIEEALHLRKQLVALEKRLSEILGGNSPSVAPEVVATGRRKMSQTTIAKMRAAQQARWAKKSGASIENEPTSLKINPAKPTQRKKKGLTPEGRARLAASMKARWAARKKNAAAPNSKSTTKKTSTKTRTVYR